MPEIFENWLGPVNNCVYYARMTREIYQTLRIFSVEFDAPGEL